ncbi:bifunctional 5,10-methylenetetrahydrofolate dehydrogenase/5,10-methenyltetrahydrofolate cyclohydrolase [Candidatus Micrarchaeota archaeon]|nr:bifunctional 5,10-methylenetetrahydrofolate dehydrogenase/5,10-methenyltetrahydrofolate cyclohydrolase [Candidatus Micrarchaeota archaeon]
MPAQLLNGKELAQKIRTRLAEDAAILAETKGRPPGLAAVLVGEDPASQLYVSRKHQACQEAGFHSELVQLSASISQDELLRKVRDLNRAAHVDGILVQLPLPKGLDEQAVLEAVLPEKDVDGFHPLNQGRLMLGLDGFVPATPTTVTVCHSKTKNLEKITTQADVLVAAVGKAGLISADHVKDGAVVVDVGTSRVGGKLKGDVDFDAVKEKASWITPVPGGVGPMTIAMLLENTFESYQKRNGV